MDKIIQNIQNIKNWNNNLTAYIFTVLIIFILLFFSLYWLVYIRNLQSNECKVFDKSYSKINNNLRSLKTDDPLCNYTFKDYYIKSAYNCCNGGAYSNDFVSTCVLKDIIKQGVRGLDLEIFSIDDDPVVASSTTDNYFVKETFNSIPFNDVINIISFSAFDIGSCPNPTDPIILHLRFKSSNINMYENMSKILEKFNDKLLGKEYSYENNKTNFGNTPLMNLLNKIIIIVDMNNPTFLKSKNFYEYVNMTSNSLFMRALTYYNIQYSPDISELTEYNKQNMTIAMPDNGSSPSNISGILVRSCGCQLICMIYQTPDSFLEENELFFDSYTYAFVLKPVILRYIPITIPEPEPPNPQLSYETRTITTDYYNFNI
jgi:hypothetical protein